MDQHGDGSFQQHSYLSAKIESPGSMESMAQAEQQHRLQGSGGSTVDDQQQSEGAASMMLANSYSMWGD